MGSLPTDPSTLPPWRLTGTQALDLMRTSSLTVTAYAESLLSRIAARDASVQAWAHLDGAHVLASARALDAVPASQRGPLHGLPIAVKDVIYTKDQPTQHNSPIYAGDAPALDAASILTLRSAGALILGKTTTTEFASTVDGPKTRNPHDATRTPGGSSSGSGAAVGDFQAPVALGTQTGGSTIRPGSFNGVYAFKPTWAAISREGQKLYSLILDTLGLYARAVSDLKALADVFQLRDDDEDGSGVFKLQGAKFAFVKTAVWPQAGEGTRKAWERAKELLVAHGAVVDEVELPGDEFEELSKWHGIVLAADGRTAFLPDYCAAKEKLHPQLVGHVENSAKISRKAQLEAFDNIAALRPKFDRFAEGYAAIVTPSVVDEAPVGMNTGSAAFCSGWTALHVPVVNVPGFQGANGMPIGLSLVSGRYRDRHLLNVAEEVGKVFEAEGGWKPSNV